MLVTMTAFLGECPVGQKTDAANDRNKEQDDQYLKYECEKSDKRDQVFNKRYNQCDEHQNAADSARCFHPNHIKTPGFIVTFSAKS